jgi:hypothetical protein
MPSIGQQFKDLWVHFPVDITQLQCYTITAGEKGVRQPISQVVDVDNVALIMDLGCTAP